MKKRKKKNSTNGAFGGKIKTDIAPKPSKRFLEDEEYRHDVFIFAMGILQKLIDHNLVTGGKQRLADKGRERFQKLSEENFEPEDESDYVIAMQMILAESDGIKVKDN